MHMSQDVIDVNWHYGYGYAVSQPRANSCKLSVRSVISLRLALLEHIGWSRSLQVAEHSEGYHIPGYFRGVLIFVIFMVHTGVMKFSTNCPCLNLDRRRFVVTLFATCGPLTVPSIYGIPILKLSCI